MVELFFDGLIDKTEAYQPPALEKAETCKYVSRTEKALSLLRFEGSETL